MTGDGGFIPELIRATPERGLQAELTDHVGYEKGDPAASAFPNSRNGTTPKTVASQVGDVELAIPRDRDGSFVPQLIPKGSRRLGGLNDMIISLYAGGMTVRDIEDTATSAWRSWPSPDSTSPPRPTPTSTRRTSPYSPPEPDRVTQRYTTTGDLPLFVRRR